MEATDLQARINAVAARARLRRVAFSVYDSAAGVGLSHRGDELFHAASTFKTAVLFALCEAAEAGRVRLDDHLQVRNRFRSIVDGSIYRVDRDRDGDHSVHQRIGRAMPLRDLASAMIVRSSNLATNLLLDFLTRDYVVETMTAAGINGMVLRRGVEDLLAHEAGLNNEISALGLVQLYRAFLDQDALGEPLRSEALNILLAQEFNTMIPAQLPSKVRVAHKTGEISDYCHDAGIIFNDEREPLVVAILTETSPETTKRHQAVAEIASLIFDEFARASLAPSTSA